MKILTIEGYKLALAYTESYTGCSCHLHAPCSDCLHPGNPINLDNSEELWEDGVVYKNWANTARQRVKAETNNRYFETIEHLRDKEHMSSSKSPQYAHTTFSGTLISDEAKALTADEILLLMDCGNLCFGGSCSKVGTKFWGSYNTD